MVQIFIQHAVCRRATQDVTQSTESTLADYGGFELSPNPAYGTVAFAIVKSDKSQDEESQPAKDDDDGNVQVSKERQPPAYENLKVLY